MPKPCHANHVNYDNGQILISPFLAPTLSPIKHKYFQGQGISEITFQPNNCLNPSGTKNMLEGSAYPISL